MRWALTIFIALNLFQVRANISDPTGVFNEANAYYEREAYDSALTTYTQLLDSYESAALYYNLGNTYYKLDSVGKAILFLERARRLSPNNADINHNLKRANQKVLDEMTTTNASRISQWWAEFTSGNYWTGLSISLQVLGFGLLTGFVVLKSRKVKQWLFYSGLTSVGLGFLSLWFASAGNALVEATDEAIVLQYEVEVQTSPLESGTVSFLLHEGTKVEITAEKEGWVEITIPGGATGWLRSSSIEII